MLSNFKERAKKKFKSLPDQVLECNSYVPSHSVFSFFLLQLVQFSLFKNNRFLIKKLKKEGIDPERGVGKEMGKEGGKKRREERGERLTSTHRATHGFTADQPSSPTVANIKMKTTASSFRESRSV